MELAAAATAAAAEAEARERVAGETAMATASMAVAMGAAEEREVGWRATVARGLELATAVEGRAAGEAAVATAPAGEAQAVVSWVGRACPTTALASRRRW